MDSVSTKFTELQNKRQQFPEGSEKRKVGLDKWIVKEKQADLF